MRKGRQCQDIDILIIIFNVAYMPASEECYTKVIETVYRTCGEVKEMLYWAAVFFIIAIVAAVFGFAGIASAAAGIAKILFFLFIAIAIIMLIIGLVGGGRFGRGTPL